MRAHKDGLVAQRRELDLLLIKALTVLAMVLTLAVVLSGNRDGGDRGDRSGDGPD